MLSGSVEKVLRREDNLIGSLAAQDLEIGFKKTYKYICYTISSDTVIPKIAFKT
jgi:hypothetical protein